MTAADPSPDAADAQIVPLRPWHTIDTDVVDAELVDPGPGRDHQPDEPTPPLSGVRAVVARWERPLPTRHQIVASTRWWAVHGGRALLLLGARAPLLALAELRPICRGLATVTSGWARWVRCNELADATRAAEGVERAKAAERLEVRRSGRARLSIALLVVAAAAVGWLTLTRPTVAAVVAIVAVGTLDAVGRARCGPAEQAAPTLPPGPLVEGVPLSSLRAEIESSLAAQGFDPDGFTVAQPQVLDGGWRIPFSSRHPFDDEHLRQVERDLQIRRGAITAVLERGNAARGHLDVRLIDPLADVVEAPDPDPLTVYQPLPLGVCASGQVWQETFLRVHGAVIGASQSGKSSCLWQMVDVLRRCPEVELDGIDLTDGPAFSACRRAFRRRAVDEDGARRVLTDAVALIRQRAGELSRLAEADDTPDDYDEKHQPTADAPQRVVLVDEFARLAEDPELLKLVEYILRYGAKCAVVLILAGQGATLADFGTSTVRAQVMLKVLFACSRRDVLDLLGKDARDAGYRPDLFEPANGDQIQDAGKCHVMSATSRSAEPRRAYRLDQAEVRRRDRQLGKWSHGAVDAVEVPPVLAVLERLADGRELVPTAEVLAELGEGWTARRLAAELREWVRPVQHPRTKERGYWAADVAQAVRDL
ncbi:MAG TPA: hypothetical protein VM367_15415 [Pseudonocardia sp.]|nr:hypothetical protein [Pseudonocardia sp.]